MEVAKVPGGWLEWWWRPGERSLRRRDLVVVEGCVCDTTGGTWPTAHPCPSSVADPSRVIEESSALY